MYISRLDSKLKYSIFFLFKTSCIRLLQNVTQSWHIEYPSQVYSVKRNIVKNILILKDAKSPPIFLIFLCVWNDTIDSSDVFHTNLIWCSNLPRY